MEHIDVLSHQVMHIKTGEDATQYVLVRFQHGYGCLIHKRNFKITVNHHGGG